MAEEPITLEDLKHDNNFTSSELTGIGQQLGAYIGTILAELVFAKILERNTALHILNGGKKRTEYLMTLAPDLSSEAIEVFGRRGIDEAIHDAFHGTLARYPGYKSLEDED